jgi:hypothetical protein
MAQVSVELTAKVSELVKLLQSAGETKWSAYMRDVHAKLAAADPAGISQLRKAYAGVGSFSDLMLGSAADQGRTAVFDEKEVELNAKLEQLRQEAFAALQRDTGG